VMGRGTGKAERYSRRKGSEKRARHAGELAGCNNGWRAGVQSHAWRGVGRADGVSLI
jgi:hypothetical protein